MLTISDVRDPKKKPDTLDSRLGSRLGTETRYRYPRLDTRNYATSFKKTYPVFKWMYSFLVKATILGR